MIYIYLHVEITWTILQIFFNGKMVFFFLSSYQPILMIRLKERYCVILTPLGTFIAVDYQSVLTPISIQLIVIGYSWIKKDK